MARISRDHILTTARAIGEGYEQDGMVLTVRQMYYQFVRRFPDEFPSAVETYNRIKDVLADARYRGDFPMEYIEDRGREVRIGNFTAFNANVYSAMDACANEIKTWPNYLNMDRWYGQRRHVSVWVEKDALSGVFEEPCDQLGVSWFACKGYPSVSALWAYLQALDEAQSAHPEGYEEAVVLYFGDHDPDGLEIPDASLRGIDTLRETYEFLEDLPIRFERVALTLDQVRRYDAPPFPAKETSSRFKKYQEKVGIQDAWELDALEPRVLRQLIRTSVGELFDRVVYDDYAAEIRAARVELIDRVQNPEWLATALAAIGGDL